MHINKQTGMMSLLVVLAFGFSLGERLTSAAAQGRQSNGTIFELRTYTANDGRLEEMLEELRVASLIFERHGMTNVGYWVPTDSPLAKKYTYLYLEA